MNDLYCDINANYNVDENSPEDILVTGIKAILLSIINIINTYKDPDGISERPFKPRVASELIKLLNDPIDEITAFKLKLYLSDVVALEPRAVLNMNKTDIIPDYNEQCYNVKLVIQDSTTKEEASADFVFTKP